MLDLFIAMLMSCTLAATLILIMHKTGFVHFVQSKGNRFFHELFSCDFCLSFWVLVIVSVIIVIFTGEIKYLTIPVGASLTRAII